MLVVGLSHRSAPIEVRERIAIQPATVGETLERLMSLPSITEAVVLSTCNRVEIYAAPHPEHGAKEAASQIVRMLSELGGREVVPHLGSANGSDAVRHLFRVASSLDSLVVGEPQILGQLKDAIRFASEAKTIGPHLNDAMRSALQVAKRVRTDTAIGEGQVSVPSVAVDLARQIFEELDGHTAVLVGAGEMAESAAKLLARAGAKIVVVNRSAERAEDLATAVGGRPAPWSDLDQMLVTADIVVASTASREPVITKKQIKGIRRERRGRSLFLIDIAVPRDIEPTVNDLDNVYLYDIDDLSHVVAQTLEGRKQEAERAEQLVAKETQAFEQRQSQLAMKPIIVALRQRTQATLTGELSRSFKGRLKHLTEDDRRALEKMVDAAVNKLLHAPSKQLKQLATSPRSAEMAHLLCQLFELELSAAADGSAEEPGTALQRALEDDDHGTDDDQPSGPRIAIR
ncbi:MAG: glutamyl-tRNA reductase [Myxococcales bacterium]|nr:glutamyl-tRNA reductase [Myxococcales bacterium]